EIDFTDGGANRAALGRDWIQALGGTRVGGSTQFVPPEVVPLSNGGAGGPGVVQLHVREPLRAPDVLAARTDIVVPLSVAFSSAPLDGVASPAAWALYPTCVLPPLPLMHGASVGSAGSAGGTLDGGATTVDPLTRLSFLDPTRLALRLRF
ncbi:MAG: hypothetical protein ABL998_16025, partial [Planctomycetota bacterium]